MPQSVVVSFSFSFFFSFFASRLSRRSSGSSRNDATASVRLRLLLGVGLVVPDYIQDSYFCEGWTPLFCACACAAVTSQEPVRGKPPSDSRAARRPRCIPVRVLCATRDSRASSRVPPSRQASRCSPGPIPCMLGLWPPQRGISRRSSAASRLSTRARQSLRRRGRRRSGSAGRWSRRSSGSASCRRDRQRRPPKPLQLLEPARV